MKYTDRALNFSRIFHAFLLHDLTSLSLGQQSSLIWRLTTSTMKDKIFNSGTEKCVLVACFCVHLCFEQRFPFLAALFALTVRCSLLYPASCPSLIIHILCILLCIDRKRGSCSSRACWIFSGAYDDQSGCRCRMTTSVSGHHPPLRPGTQVAIWTVKGKLSRSIQFRPNAWKW